MADGHTTDARDSDFQLPESAVTFMEAHDFVQLYRSYEWGVDTWRSGFPRVLELEVRLGNAAKRNRLSHEDLVAVQEWGNKRGRSVESPDEVTLSLYAGGALVRVARLAPEAPLLELARQVKHFGPTYLSKVLRFAAPEHYGAIDTRLVTVVGRGGYGWVDLHVRDDGSGPHIPKTQMGWPSAFGKWTCMLRAFAQALNARRVVCPHPDPFVSGGLRSGGEWFPADVEMALFAHASQQMGATRLADAAPCRPRSRGAPEGAKKRLDTWAGRSSFRYEGSVAQGTTIHYGTGYTAAVSDHQFRRLLAHFSGRTVPIGTSRDNPPAGSVGAWLQDNVTPTAIASYVGPILLSEGYAEKVGRSDIRFK